MVSMERIFFLLTILAVASADNDGSKTDSKTKLKTLVHEVSLRKTFDDALPQIRHYIAQKGYDPMDIPDIEIPLSHLPALLKTKLHLHHGHMQGLSTIYRTGDIDLQWSKNKVSLYLNIGFEMLDLSHEYSLRFIFYNRKGECYGRYHDVQASMLVDIDLSTRKINLKFFKFTGVGDFKLRLEGNTGDKIINFLTEAITTVFRTEILWVIEKRIYDEIDKTIEDMNDKMAQYVDPKIEDFKLENVPNLQD